MRKSIGSRKCFRDEQLAADEHTLATDERGRIDTDKTKTMSHKKAQEAQEHY